MTFRLLSVAALAAVCVCAQSPIQGLDSASGPLSATLVVTGGVQRANPEDAAPLPSDLHVTFDCHGVFYNAGGTDQAGRFRYSFTPDPLAIAADSFCLAEAKAFGFDSTTARFLVRSSSGLIDIGVVTIERNASGAQSNPQNKDRTGKTVSATSLKAPANAVKLFDHGSRLLQQGKFADASRDFEAAVKIYPAYAEAWLNLGRARVSMDSFGIARDAFLRAAELDPQMAGPPQELGLLAARQNDLVTAARYLDDSLRLDPGGSYMACYSDAIVNLMLKRYDVAERSARAALRFGDTGPQARVNYVLGMALLATNNNVEAKKHLLRYLELSPKAPERDQVEKEIGRLEQMESRE